MDDAGVWKLVGWSVETMSRSFIEIELLGWDPHEVLRRHGIEKGPVFTVAEARELCYERGYVKRKEPTQTKTQCENVSHESKDDDKTVRAYRSHDEHGEFVCTSHYCDPCATELQECGDDIRSEEECAASVERLDKRVRAIIDPARESDGGDGTMVSFGYETLYARVRAAIVETEARPRLTNQYDTVTVYNCSFCGKGKDEVKQIIAGPLVFICDECIWLCHDIVTAT
jgi:hypothetical protein